jgi:hypothetical protein
LALLGVFAVIGKEAEAAAAMQLAVEARAATEAFSAVVKSQDSRLHRVETMLRFFEKKLDQGKILVADPKTLRELEALRDDFDRPRIEPRIE